MRLYSAVEIPVGVPLVTELLLLALLHQGYQSVRAYSCRAEGVIGDY